MMLAELSGMPVPAWITRARKRLQDAMVDTHFHVTKRYGISWVRT